MIAHIPAQIPKFLTKYLRKCLPKCLSKCLTQVCDTNGKSILSEVFVKNRGTVQGNITSPFLLHTILTLEFGSPTVTRTRYWYVWLVKMTCPR